MSWQPIETAPNPLACYDCGLPYGGGDWIEAVVPHEVWNNHLSPTGDEGGILCINCMARRAVDANLTNVPVRLTAGPFVAGDENYLKRTVVYATLVRATAQDTRARLAKHEPQWLHDAMREIAKFADTILAIATEARRAETAKHGSVHDGPVAESDAPKDYRQSEGE